MTDPIAIVQAGLEESARVKRAMQELAPAIARVADRMADVFRAGGHLYACGNGGSACDAVHLVEELVARYKRDRPGLPAHHLLDAATLTCWSNDYDFEGAFARQVQTLVGPKDLLLAISTSGNSPNIVRAVEVANERGAFTIGLTGRDGGRLAALCSDTLVVPSDATERIQEGHITIIHLLCELVERILFGDLEKMRNGPADSPSA
ncbi:MAG TPA: SIS domain-containing protein [Longimicrobiaceae bacterium]